jgi:hypothetical protein
MVTVLCNVMMVQVDVYLPPNEMRAVIASTTGSKLHRVTRLDRKGQT